MLDDAPKKKFKEYIMQRRDKFKYGDFSDVSSDCKFLPIDLSLMLAFMFQCIVHRQFYDKMAKAEEE